MLLLVCLVVCPALARQGPPSRGAAGGVSKGPPSRGAAGGVSKGPPSSLSSWSQSGTTWNCHKLVSLTVPKELTATAEEPLLSVKMPKSHFYAAYGLSQDRPSALAALKKMKAHLKSVGEVKLGKIAHIAANPKLQLAAREGQVKIDGVFYYVAMGYFTNRASYLSFIVSYPSSQADRLKPKVAALMNSVKFN